MRIGLLEWNGLVERTGGGKNVRSLAIGIFGVVVAVTTAFAAPPGGSARGLPAGALQVEPSMIVDHTGFERPIAAATLFIPKGWRTQGGVVWGQQFLCTNGYNFDWSAVSADALSRIAVLPQERWEANNYGAAPSMPGCQSAPFTNVRQYLEHRAQRVRPDARLLDFRVRADLQQQFAQLNSNTPMPMGETRTWVEAGEVWYAYTHQGREMQGTLAAVVVFTLTRTNPGMGMGVMDVLNAATFPVYAASAPSGQLNPNFVEAIRRSIKINPQWESRINNHNAAIGRVAIEEAGKRSAAIARSNAEISRIREEAWNAYQESSDRRAREFGEALRGVETYRDDRAAGGQVTLSHLYDHAWRLNDGSYVLSNDSSFEPWRDLGLEGRKLEAAP